MPGLISFSETFTLPVQGSRILVVEDEYFLAEDLRGALDRQGAEVLGPVPTVSEALELLSNGPAPDLAILDINLQGETVYPQAEALSALGIPFVFATGHDAQALPQAYADVLRVEKPFDLQQVTDVALR